MPLNQGGEMLRAAAFLQTRLPACRHGLTQIYGVETAAPYFNESLPLRNQPPFQDPGAPAAGSQFRTRVLNPA